MQLKSEVIATLLSTIALLTGGAAAWSDSQSKHKEHETEIRNLKEVDKEMRAAAQANKEDVIKRLDRIEDYARQIALNQQRK